MKYRPARVIGTATGAAVVAIAGILATLLVAFAVPWDISTAKFLAFVGATALVALALLFAYWTYACFTMSYALDEKGLSIRWGLLRQFVPLSHIERFVPGREARLSQIRGVNWWGYHVGRGNVAGLGEVLFYSTHRSAWEPTYIVTPTRTYAVSPQNGVRFNMDLQRLLEAKKEPEEAAEQRAELPVLATHPFWFDRYAQALLAAAVLTSVALLGFVFGVYPGLADHLNLAFPPVGEPEFRPKREVLQIPLTALAVLAVSLAAGLVVHRWERGVSYLLFTGAIFLQGLFWVAAAIAIT
jgi:hypothetical protein